MDRHGIFPIRFLLGVLYGRKTLRTLVLPAGDDALSTDVDAPVSGEPDAIRTSNASHPVSGLCSVFDSEINLGLRLDRR
jgi:hypothetical protein